MGSERHVHRRLVRRAPKIVSASILAGLVLVESTPGAVHATSLVANLRCGDVIGLVDAMGSTSSVTVINLNVDRVAQCTYVLTAPYGTSGDGLPPVSRLLSIKGNGSTITRSSASSFRILEVTAPGIVAIAGLTVSNANVDAAVQNSGVLTLADSAVTGNAGGAIANASGILRVTRTTVTGNGWGIQNVGALALSDSVVRGNRGGGLSNWLASTLVVTNTIVDGNAGIGLINNGGATTLENTVISNSSGGGINNMTGTVTVTGGSINGNSGYAACPLKDPMSFGQSCGGGIYNSLGVVTLSGTTISGNSATYGGGIYNDDDSTVTMNATTVSGNAATNLLFLGGGDASGAGGGIWNNSKGVVTLIDSTVTGNSVLPNPITGEGEGGGIWNSGRLSLTRGIVSDNDARGGGCGRCRPGSGGGIFNAGPKALAIAVRFVNNNPDNCFPSGSVIGCRG